MEYKKLNGEIYLRIDPREEIVEKISEVSRRERILGGHFQGIGYCTEITISTFSPEDKKFSTHDFSGHFEILSLLGNVSCTQDLKLNIHAHANFSYINEDKKITTFGGKIKKIFVENTAEIILTPANEIIQQRFDIAEGFGVWQFKK